MSDLIQVESVSKRFIGRQGPPVEALKDVSLSIECGEFVMVVGPSGSGKSTLLFALGGMQRPSRGRVLMDATDVYALSASQRAGLRRKRIGFIFQTFNLLPYLNCLENIAVPAVLDGRPRSAAFSRGRELLERVGLSNRVAHRPAELSVGERQRVALCRSLINEPDLLLADEPTGNLDSESTLEVLRMLKELNSERLTVVLVTHDLNLAEQGTRVIRLLAGVVEEDRVCEEQGYSA